MAADPTHLSLSMASTLASGQSSQQPQSQPQAQTHQQPTAPNNNNNNNNNTEGQETSPVPTKRGPGRPKGSTKKTLEADPSTPKTKRPVGRPRKDGRPAGSVPKVARGPGRPRKNFPPDFAVNTFPQQQQSQQSQGDQQEWPPMGMFNNYRLPKDATSDTPGTAAVADSANADRTSASSGTADSNSNVTQTPKWFPAAPPANPAAASSSSIANALIHPPSMSQSARPNHLVDPLTAMPSALGSAGNHVNNASDVRAASRTFVEASSSIPIAQIPDFILSTIYSLFSRQPASGLSLPRDVLSTYRAHLVHLSGSHAVAYNILKTFWLPYSPVLFRLVLPRTGASKASHRNSSGSVEPSSSSHNHLSSHSNHSNVNGQNQNANRTSAAGDQTYDTHRFFYWDPFHLPLSGPLSCPVCQQGQLAHCGSIRTGPLRVFDLPSSSSPSASAHAHSAGLVPTAFYVIGMQYGCTLGACGARLNSWDPRIVNNLPQVLADEWPVHLASVSQEAEPNDRRGTGLSGNAVSRPLYTLVRSLVQAGTPQEGIRDILAKLWNWSDSERDDDHEGDEEEEDPGIEENSENDKEKVVEALFASPYQRLWNAHTAQNHEVDASASISNGQRPAKRQRRDEVAPNNALMVSASGPGPTYSSRLFGSHGNDSGPGGLALQIQPAPEHRTNGAGPEHRSPQSQLQLPPPPPPQARPQVAQSQLKPNGPTRPPPSSRTSITHTHAPHIHTPSPIYPSTSLPNSNTNSPQTGQGAALNLKRPLEPETHHQASGGGPSIPSAPASAQTSPAQPQFSGLVHNSPYTHIRSLQHAQVGRAPQQAHPQQARPQQQPHPTHHHPSATARHEPPLHMHPSLVHPSNVLPRFNPQASLHSHQSLLSTAPQPAQPQPAQQPQPQQPPVQRRVRHCVKCGRHDCKGKGGSQFCKNPCKDCGGMDCRGRNSKRPNATCREGW